MQQQGFAPDDDAPGLLDLHGGPPENTGQQLETKLPEITELNALLTECHIVVDGEGNSTTNLQLHSAPDDAPGLLEMHGGPLANIWQQLCLKDRKALYRTCSQLRESTDLNALLTDCQIEVDRQGNSTTDLQQNWPHHAPPPQRLRIMTAVDGCRLPGLIKFLRVMSSQEDSVQLLQGVQELQVQIHRGGWTSLAAEDAADVASMLQALTPNAVSLRLLSTSPISIVQPLAAWGAVRTLIYDSAEDFDLKGDLAAIAQLTQLTSLSVGWDLGKCPTGLGCLSALTSLQSIKLCSADCAYYQVHRHHLALIAQGCSQLTRLQLDGIALSAAPTSPHQQHPMLTCTWPSLVELYMDSLGAGVISFLLPTPQAAPQLAHIRMISLGTELARWPPVLQCASFNYASKTAEECAAQVVLLAADVQCLAAYGCQGLSLQWCLPQHMHVQLDFATILQPLAHTLTHLQFRFSFAWRYEDQNESEVQVQFDFAAMLQPLAQTLTHLHIHVEWRGEDQKFLAPGWGKTLAQALPNIRDVSLSFSPGLSELSEFVLYAKTLCALELCLPSDSEVIALLLACGVARATSREELLTVMMGRPKSVFFEKWSEAVSLWQDVCSKQQGPASVRVVDEHGVDWLAL